MPQSLTIPSSLPPQNILQSLERAAIAWRAAHHASRFQPPNTDGIQVSLHRPRFKLAYIKTTRVWTHPICVGSVTSDGTGSTIKATIRLSRETLAVPVMWLILCAVSWIRGDLTLGPSIIIMTMLGVGGLIGATTVAFSGLNQEAEVDALRAILQSAANGDLA